MKRLQLGFTALEAMVVVFVLAGIGGWIANIVKLIGMDAIMTGMGIARIVGIFVAPLGSVLGFV